MDSADCVPVHLLPDSERLLKAHQAWVTQWDQPDEEPDLDVLVQTCYDWYCDGYEPQRVKWRLAAEYPLLPARVRNRIQARAEEALLRASKAPLELRRALVAAQRQQAIAGALAAGEWGPALRGLERAGDLAGEGAELGLSPEDLVLRVEIEAPAPALSDGGQSQPVSPETDSSVNEC